MRTSELPRLLRHAWRAALADTPRPTHLDFNGLQGDVIELGQTGEPPVLETEARRIPVHRPVADERDIERAAAVLTGARRLVIVAGDGAAASGAGPEVLALAEALAAPVATTLGARGIIPTTHRLSAGVAGSYSAPPANRIVHGADLVLFIGCDTGDQVTLNWPIPADRHQDRADRRRPAGDRPQLPEHDRARRRPEGDAGPAHPGRRQAGARRRATPRRRRASSPIGAPAMAPLGREEHGADPRRAAVRRDHPRLAGRRRPGRRYRLFRDLDRHDDRAQRRRADLSARGGLARLGVPGLARREMRRRAAQGGVLHRRRRVLLPPRRIGDRRGAAASRRPSSSTTIPASART